MNPFDAAIYGTNSGGMAGIGSDLRNLGKKLDRNRKRAIDNSATKHVRVIKSTAKLVEETTKASLNPNLRRNVKGVTAAIKKDASEQYDLREDFTKEQWRITKLTWMTTAEFLATDIGKAIAIIAIIVSMVVGLGPVVMQGMQQAMALAQQGAQAVMKAAAEYIAKQFTLEALKKRAINYAINKAVEYGAEKASEYYIEKKRKELTEKLEAEYAKEFEAKIKAEYEAQYGAYVGNADTIISAANTATNIHDPYQTTILGPDKKPIPAGFKWTGKAPTSEQINESRGKALEGYIAAYNRAREAYVKANPESVKAGWLAATQGVTPKGELLKLSSAYSAREKEKLDASLDAAMKRALAIAEDPEVAAVRDQLAAEGLDKNQILDAWKSSQVYKDSVRVTTTQAAEPAVKSLLEAKGYTGEDLEDYTTIVSVNVGEELAKKETSKSIAPLAIGGALLSLLLLG